MSFQWNLDTISCYFECQVDLFCGKENKTNMMIKKTILFFPLWTMSERRRFSIIISLRGMSAHLTE